MKGKGRKASNKNFGKTAKKTHPFNRQTPNQTGGFRL